MALSLYDQCKQKGISMLEVAQRSGIDLMRVQAIYLGRWTPSPNERKKIAEVLQVEADDIAWGHKTPIQHIYGHGPG